VKTEPNRDRVCLSDFAHAFRVHLYFSSAELLLSCGGFSQFLGRANTIWKNGVVWEVRSHSRSLKIGPFGRAHTGFISFHSNYVPILYRFWNIAIYWSKIADLNLPNLYVGPRRVWPGWNFIEIFGIVKLESLGDRTALFAWSVQPA